MTNKDKATARPWQVDKGGLFIEPCNVSILTKNIALCKPSRYSGREAMANAKLIVKSVNMHDDLVEMINDVKDSLNDLYKAHPEIAGEYFGACLHNRLLELILRSEA